MKRLIDFRIRYILSLLLVCCFTAVTAQVENETGNFEGSSWHGFERFDFEFEGKEAHIVLPIKALPGNPWVWRARFPNWHIEMDSILLSEGFHVAFINTNNQFGSPKAVSTWNKFYRFITDKYKLDKKVSLEGVSRGGLFIYNWAKQNPEKVNCIYAEAPVCDFRSWPGGFETGIGSKDDLESLKTEYGFGSDEEAKAWKDQPIDNLEKLAEAKVPVLHMVSLNDKVVPPSENSFTLINRYTKLGGPATIIPCTKGEQKLHGHHFSIESPRLGADFIKYHTRATKQN